MGLLNVGRIEKIIDSELDPKFISFYDNFGYLIIKGRSYPNLDWNQIQNLPPVKIHIEGIDRRGVYLHWGKQIAVVKRDIILITDYTLIDEGNRRFLRLSCNEHNIGRLNRESIMLARTNYTGFLATGSNMGKELSLELENELCTIRTNILNKSIEFNRDLLIECRRLNDIAWEQALALQELVALTDPQEKSKDWRSLADLDIFTRSIRRYYGTPSSMFLRQDFFPLTLDDTLVPYSDTLLAKLEQNFEPIKLGVIVRDTHPVACSKGYLVGSTVVVGVVDKVEEGDSPIRVISKVQADMSAI